MNRSEIPDRIIPLIDGQIVLSVRKTPAGIMAERFHADGSFAAKGTGMTLHDAISGCFHLRDKRGWTHSIETSDSERVRQIVRYIEETKGRENGA